MSVKSCLSTISQCQFFHVFFAIFQFVQVLQMKHAFPYLFLWSFSVHDVCASLGQISWDFPVLFRRQNPTSPWEWYWALSGNWIWKKFSHFDFCFHFFLWFKTPIRSSMWVWVWWVLFLGKFLPFEVGLTFFDLRTKGKIGSGAGWRGMEGPSRLESLLVECFLFFFVFC